MDIEKGTVQKMEEGYTEIEQTIASQYGIRSIPTMILFQNGRELARQSGSMGKSDIVMWVQTQI